MLVRIARIFAVPCEPTTRTVSPAFSFSFNGTPLVRRSLGLFLREIGVVILTINQRWHSDQTSTIVNQIS
jgi:hypothetical protein